ncbi:hypothetical protein [Nakamurella aerolata]|uniref:Uncharacterized protein n=1 Tax=Nakamurella aerolata TaxID=1656892 RepID=A0A849A2R3_9ACTN|nr:hypothetical protein [Nakamurella aerolata]NNG34855.1 hypothetical protein [Nakamurella aerolata]
MYPQLTGGPIAGNVQNASRSVAVDLLFTDGSRLSDTGVVANNGAPLDPRAQAGKLTGQAWNTVRATIPAAAGGKMVKSVLLHFGSDVIATAGNKDGYLRGWIDDVALLRPTG